MEELDRAYLEVEAEVPAWLARTLEWLRDPDSRLVRIPVAVLFIVASFFFWLPVIGLELLPLGLMLIAQDVPVLRRPIARMLHWLVKQWRRLKACWLARRR